MIDELLSDEGWPYASTPPVEEGDPGPLPLPVRARLADHRAAAAAGAARRRARHAARARRRQGRASHPGTLEEPGKIGHEFRDAAPREFVDAGWRGEGPFAYYGTADATSWFLVLADRRRRLRRRAAGGGRVAGRRARPRRTGSSATARGSGAR